MKSVLIFSLLEAFAMAFVVMTVLWAITEWLKNSSLVDAAWSLCILIITLHFFAHGKGFWLRSALGAALVLVWALRLSLFIFNRNHGKAEDPRYTALRESWGEKQKIRMLQFFWAQGAAAAFFTLPFILLSAHSAPKLHASEWVGTLLILIAVAGETSADLSLKKFKNNPASRGKTCRAGLWNYSRHPNYFFEWLVWCGFALFASTAPWGWAAWSCPALMLHFLLNVTGIPKTEEQSLKSRGDDYREYQRTTSKFIPWFKNQ